MTLDNQVRIARERSNLLRELEPIIQYLDDPSVTDIIVNSNKSLWVKSLGQPMYNAGNIEPDISYRILVFTASMLGKKITAEFPTIDGVLPLEKYPARISGVMPPWTTGPTFCIRKPSEKVFTLDDYVRSRRARAAERDIILDAIHAHDNIVVAGGTGSGKTTLINAIIHEIVTESPEERIYIVEDTAEIRCMSQNNTSLVVDPTKSAYAVRQSLRFAPDRIIFGELRYGETALELLKAWNTGHPGGVTTLHANSAESVLSRLQNLLDEVNLKNPETLIEESIGLIIYMKRGAKIGEIKRLKE